MANEIYNDSWWGESKEDEFGNIYHEHNNQQEQE